MMTTAAGQVSDNLQQASNMLLMDRHYGEDQLLQQQNILLIRQKEFRIKEMEMENERERVRANEEIERNLRMRNRESQNRENEIRVSKQSRVSADRGPNLLSLGYEGNSASHVNGGRENRGSRDGAAVSNAMVLKSNQEVEDDVYVNDYGDDRSSRISGDNSDGLDDYSIAFDIERSRMSTGSKGFKGFNGLAETLPVKKDIATSSNAAFSTSVEIPRERNWRDLRGLGSGGGGGGGLKGGDRGGGGGRVYESEHAHSQVMQKHNISRSGSKNRTQDSDYSDTFEDDNDNNIEDDDYNSTRAGEVVKKVEAQAEGDSDGEIEEDSGYLSRSHNKFHAVGEQSRSLINDSVPYDVTYEEEEGEGEECSDEDSGIERLSPQSSYNRTMNDNRSRSKSNSMNRHDVNKMPINVDSKRRIMMGKRISKRGEDRDAVQDLRKRQKELSTREMNAEDSGSSSTYTSDSYSTSDDKITACLSPSAQLLLRSAAQSPPRFFSQHTGVESDSPRNQSSSSPGRRLHRYTNTLSFSYPSLFMPLPFPTLSSLRLFPRSLH